MTAETHSDVAAGRVALVTGAGRRIGRTLALGLAEAGFDVAVHFRRSAGEAEAVVREIRERGRRAVAVAADLGVADDAAALVPQVARVLGTPTCLVNNASEFLHDDVQTMTLESWSSHIDVNLRAPVLLAQALAAELPDGATGNVINIIDQRVWRLTPEFFSYTLSKAGLWSATRMLAQALAPRVRVNAIGPGPVLASVHQTPDEFVAECRSTLLGRATDPAEIAAAVRFILDAPAMTGQMIALDAGQHLAWSEAPASSTRAAVPPGSR